MTYNIITKKFNLADSSKEKILDKVRKLDKFFDDDSNECKIIVSEIRDDIAVEITFKYKGFLIRAEDQNHDMLTAVDNCLAAIDRQIRKNKQSFQNACVTADLTIISLLKVSLKRLKKKLNSKL